MTATSRWSDVDAEMTLAHADGLVRAGLADEAAATLWLSKLRERDVRIARARIALLEQDEAWVMLPQEWENACRLGDQPSCGKARSAEAKGWLGPH